MRMCNKNFKGLFCHLKQEYQPAYGQAYQSLNKAQKHFLFHLQK